MRGPSNPIPCSALATYAAINRNFEMEPLAVGRSLVVQGDVVVKPPASVDCRESRGTSHSCSDVSAVDSFRVLRNRSTCGPARPSGFRQCLRQPAEERPAGGSSMSVSAGMSVVFLAGLGYILRYAGHARDIYGALLSCIILPRGLLRTIGTNIT